MACETVMSHDLVFNFTLYSWYSFMSQRTTHDQKCIIFVEILVSIISWQMTCDLFTTHLLRKCVMSCSNKNHDDLLSGKSREKKPYFKSIKDMSMDSREISSPL